MASCPNGHEIPEGAAFCNICGADTRVLCINGHPNVPDAQFCEICGAGQPTPLPKEDETALVTDPVPGVTGTQPVVIDASDLGSSGDDTRLIVVPDDAPEPMEPNGYFPTDSVAPFESGSTREPSWGAEPTAIAMPMTDATEPVPIPDNMALTGVMSPPSPQPSNDDKSKGAKNKKVLFGAEVVVVLVIIGVVAAVALGGHASSKTSPPPRVKPKVVRPVATTSTSSSTSTTSTTSVPSGLDGWTYPTPIAGAAASGGSNNTLSDLSCVADYTCWAVDSGGNIYHSTARGIWTTEGTDTSGGLNGISCPTSTFCAAVDGNGNAMVMSRSTWSDPISIDSNGGGLTSISCASSTFCVAVDQDGNAITFTGSSTNWATATASNNQGGLESVSCPTRSFCMAVGNDEVVLFNGSTWTDGQAVSTGNSLAQVSCASSSFCVATDGQGNAYIWNGTGWAAPTPLNTSDSGNGITIVPSCAGVGNCIAVDGTGAAYVLSDGSWGTPVHVDGNNQFQAISCAATTSCAAVDTENNVLYYGGP
jgi:hypothetical protein